MLHVSPARSSTRPITLSTKCSPLTNAITFLFWFQLFQGNKDDNSVVTNTFSPPIVARFIRLHPVEFKRWPSLRMELYGCHSGENLHCDCGLLSPPCSSNSKDPCFKNLRPVCVSIPFDRFYLRT